MNTKNQQLQRKLAELVSVRNLENQVLGFKDILRFEQGENFFDVISEGEMMFTVRMDDSRREYLNENGLLYEMDRWLNKLELQQ